MGDKLDVGQVKWFDETKKYGAISPLGEDEEDVLFELDEEDETILTEGQLVEFAKEGTRAKKIVSLD